MTESQQLNPQQPQEVPDRLSRQKSSLQHIIQILQSISSSSSPQFVTTRHSILIILLCLILYFIYQLTHYFINTILFAFLAGVAYIKLRERFVNYCKHQNRVQKLYDLQFFLWNITLLTFFLFLPWVSELCSGCITHSHIQIKTVVNSFWNSSNRFIRCLQFLLFMNIFYNLFGNKLDRYIFISNMNDRTIKVLNIILAVSVFIILLFILVLFITTVALQLRNATKFAKERVQTSYNCSFFADQGANKTKKTHCKDSIPQTFKHLIPEIDSQTLQRCIDTFNSTQTQYLGFTFPFFQENICMGVSIADKINPAVLKYFSQQSTNIFVGILSGLFGVIINVFAFFSNKIFEFTTFTSIFLATVANYESSSHPFHILGAARVQLVNKIAVIIQASIFIAIQHLICSIVLLQIFHFSSMNILLSIFLSLIAFIPYLKPSFIMVLITMCKMVVMGDWVPSVLCAVLYWFISEYIYHRHYAGVGLHKVVINLSVVFGIYQFGFFGIFYGPLLIVLCQSIYEELLK